jgi:hypothetical protein
VLQTPSSGRQKLVVLTPKGRAFLDSVAERATQVVADTIAEVPDDLLYSAILYFEYLTRGFERVRNRNRSRLTRLDQQLAQVSKESPKGAD